MEAILLRIDAPEQAWCSRLSTSMPDIGMTVHSCFPRGEGKCVEMVEVFGAGRRAAIDQLRQLPMVGTVATLEDRPTSLMARMEVTGCPVERLVEEIGLPPRFPIEVRGGTHEWLILGSTRGQQDLMDILDRMGIDHDVVFAGEWRPERTLTDRQQELLDHAVRSGYYDYPRRITLTELAAKVGVAKSTLSESLMMVEREVIARFVAGRTDGWS